MASWSERLPENAPGNFYVDSSCIDCDLCRQLAPRVFAASSKAEQSFVARQPTTPQETETALMALVACPTSSIGTQPKLDVAAAVRAFPAAIADEVYFCGFASESSFGASSY